MDTHPAHLELTDTHPTHLSSHTMAMNLIMAAVQTMHTVRKRPWRMIRITAGRLTVPCLAIAGIAEPSTRTVVSTTPAPSRNRSIGILPDDPHRHLALLLSAPVQEATGGGARGAWRQIGPCVLEAWGAKWIAVRCPHEHADLMRGAGGLWEPGGGCG